MIENGIAYTFGVKYMLTVKKDKNNSKNQYLNYASSLVTDFSESF